MSRERHTDTRSRIQQVALELFTEQGYEKTALREIAERLGVTKAALYYHFKTKEDIIGSIVEDSASRIDDLVEWAKTQPRSQETRHEVVRRYGEMARGRRQMMRFMQENQPALRDLKIGEIMKQRMMGLFDVLTEPDAPLTDQIRHRLALFAVHFGMMSPGLDATDDELDAAALKIAMELVES